MADALPSYAEVAIALEQVASLTEPAECHGIVVGQLCAAPRFDPVLWLRHVFNGDPAATAESLHCVNLLTVLAKDVDGRLKSNGLELELFLPDTGSLAERVDALAAWSRGFLLGISLAGLKDLDFGSADTREFINDLGEIARADTDSLSPTQDENDDERAYAEIVEYVRVGALLVREDALFGTSGVSED